MVRSFAFGALFLAGTVAGLLQATAARGAEEAGPKLSLKIEVVNKKAFTDCPIVLRTCLRNESQRWCTVMYKNPWSYEVSVIPPAGDEHSVRLRGWGHPRHEDLILEPGGAREDFVLLFWNLARDDNTNALTNEPVFRQSGRWQVRLTMKANEAAWDRFDLDKRWVPVDTSQVAGLKADGREILRARALRDKQVVAESNQMTLDVSDPPVGVAVGKIVLDLSEEDRVRAAELLVMPGGDLPAPSAARELMNEAVEKALVRMLQECQDPLSVYLAKHALAWAYVGRVSQVWEEELYAMTKDKNDENISFDPFESRAMAAARKREAGTIKKLDAVLASEFPEEYIPPYKRERELYAVWTMIWKANLKKAREACEGLSKGDDWVAESAQGILEHWHIYADSVK